MRNLFSKYKAFLISGAIISPGIISYAVGSYQFDEYLKEKKQEEIKESQQLANDIKLGGKKFGSIVEFKALSREQQLNKLDQISKKYTNINNKDNGSIEKLEELDLIVIGGGATGTGVALDAQTRGMKVALFEKNDFSSGTSSKSTKLIHGGIRYLESAIMNLDYSELELVKEALSERSNLLRNAPHLSRPLPIVIPAYSYIDIPKFWIGCKLYDFFYPFKDIPKSHIQSKEQTYKEFPFLREGMLSSQVYYDGQHNDSRMNVAIALTAAKEGAITLNYMEVIDLIKENNTHVNKDTNEIPENKIKGVIVKDRFTGKKYQVPAKVVVNATGPYSDSIRKLDNPDVEPIVTAAAGVHIVLPGNLVPSDKGFLNPKTKDGRVLFILPFEGKTVIGTTDEPSAIVENPQPFEKDVEFILENVRSYSKPDIKFDSSQVLAAWSGIRPLVKQTGVDKTSQINRSHSIRESPSGLITIVGGKWTTYRSMAQDTVNQVLSRNTIIVPKPCITATLPLVGGENYNSEMPKYLKEMGLEEDITTHLAHSYGDQAPFLIKLAKETNSTKRLVDGFPYIEAEVIYGVQKEYACTAEDIIGRRTRLSFLDHDKAELVLPKVIDIMAPLLKWDKSRKDLELKNSKEYLKTMHALPFNNINNSNNNINNNKK